MRGLGLTIACCAVVAAGSSQAAALITATGETGAVLTRSTNVNNGTTTYGSGDLDGEWKVQKQGASFEAVLATSQGHVSFENGVAAAGKYAFATSTSTVDVTVTNTGSQALSIAKFGSTIIPAGLGFYIQDRTGPAQDSNIFTGYGELPAAYDDNGVLIPSATTFSSFATTAGQGAANPFAFADFSFDITAAGYADPLYQLSGSMSLYYDGNGKVQQGYNLSKASLALMGFQAVEGIHGLDTVYAYKWDSTDIEVELNAILNPGQSQIITYATKVSAFTRTDCIGRGGVNCIVAYAGFGDPVGRGGAVEEEAFARGFIGIDSECDKVNRGGAIDHIEFCPVEFDPVRLLPGGGPTNAVPEPSTWAMLIAGFGAIGGTLRRRRSLVSQA